MNYCMGCMRRIEPGESVCPVCGWKHGVSTSQEYALPPTATLHDGKYLVGRVLGQGGFGITYIGVDLSLNLKVAIKEYYPQTMVSRSHRTSSLVWHGPEGSKQRGRESFIKEARNMAKINYLPNVVQVREVFYQNETAYIIMNYVEGETLHKRILSKGTLNEEEALQLFTPVMDALAKAHKMGLIHRDISPDNIMIDNDGMIWIMDMGAAKEMDVNQQTPGVSNSTSLVVRRGFSPFEQFTDTGSIGPWTDVYALSATVFFALTGNTPPDALSRIEKKEIVIPSNISPAMQQVLQKGLAFFPADRYHSMEEFKNAWIEALRNPEAVEEGPAEVQEKPIPAADNLVTAADIKSESPVPSETQSVVDKNSNTPTNQAGNTVQYEDMGFFEAVKICFSKYVSIKGRARRKEYWYFFLFNNIVSTVLFMLAGAVEGSTFAILYILWSLITICPGFTVNVRRLHDTGKSGLYILWLLLPIIGAIIYFVALFTDSEPGDNKYGPFPKKRT